MMEQLDSMHPVSLEISTTIWAAVSLHADELVPDPGNQRA